MNREEAFQKLKEHLNKENLIKHSLAVEAAMRKMARYFEEDEDRWRIAGLLHDIDYEEVEEMENHSLKGAKMAKEYGLDDEIVMAIKTHNPMHGKEPQSLMGKALFCIDPATGLVVANTLVLPSKKIKDLTVESLIKHFDRPAFAKGVNRENIKKCSDYLDLELEDFFEIVLQGMQNISSDLDL